VLPDTSALVLAGGRSVRMGSPKALLLFDGEPLIAHTVRLLRRLFADVLIAAAPGQQLPPLPARIVEDAVPHQGPVGGLCAGLGSAHTDVVFVTACDSPFLNPALIAWLVSRLDACDLVLPRWQGRDQPVHAVYRRSVLPVLREQLARGKLRAGAVAGRVRTRTIEEDEIRRFDPDGLSFLTMNTPADYAAALARWRARADHDEG
jgi:molybdopterin-guanine dinucleotide biosynthesis protein A